MSTIFSTQTATGLRNFGIHPLATNDFFQLPKRYKGMPEVMIPFLKKDLPRMEDSGLIRMTGDGPWKAIDNFIANPNKENLEALIYLLLADLHYGYYPWREMEDFRDAVETTPDCGSAHGILRDTLEAKGCKVCSLWFVNGQKDSEFTTIIKTPCGKYFACDQAAWHYGPEDSPWYYVMEVENVHDGIKKLEDYFHTKARTSSQIDNKNWHLLEGTEECTIRWIEEGDMLLEETKALCAKIRGN